MLLHSAEEKIQDIFENLENIGTTYQHAVDALSNYFRPQQNVAMKDMFLGKQNRIKKKCGKLYNKAEKLSITRDFADGTVNDMIRNQITENFRSQV